MPKRSGRRVQIKRIRYQIKQCLILDQDPFPLYLQLRKIENSLPNLPETSSKYQNPNYKLIPLDLEINYPNFKNIKKTDPRYLRYKLLFLFGN